ncbi:Fe-S oxidoreductase [Paraburkholderia sp. WSM4179]|nr:Fe-S oxidoreductase [Paraburkholderia sp. WSM4179]
MNGETALADKLGGRWKLLDTGCCGMAGSFGFDNEYYDVSMKVARKTTCCRFCAQRRRMH